MMLAVASGCPTFELSANQHTPFADPFVRPLFGGQEVTSGFSGTYTDDGAEVFGTTLVGGSRSMSFRATLKRLTDLWAPRLTPSLPRRGLVVLARRSAPGC